MKPTIGRIVHYQSIGMEAAEGGPGYPSETQPALITQVRADGTVTLKVFSTVSIFDLFSVPFAEEPQAGHWNWPPRG